jgi:hypothetical protein
MGGVVNYSDVAIRLSFEINRRKLYAIWVLPV